MKLINKFNYKVKCEFMYKIIEKAKIKLIVLISLLFVCVLASSLFAYADTQQTIRVGYLYIDNFVEYENGEYWGYGVEYLNQIAQYTNWEYKYIPVSYAEGEKMLAEGDIDILLPTDYTEKKAEHVDFSVLSIGKHYSVLAARKGDNRFNFNNISAIDGCTLGVVNNTLKNIHIDKFAARLGVSFEVIQYDNVDMLLEALGSEEVDFIITGGPDYDEDIKTLISIDEVPMYIAVRKGNSDILQRLNIALDAILTDDVNYNTRMYSKYYEDNFIDFNAYTDLEMQYIEEKHTVRIGIERDFNSEEKNSDIHDGYSDIYVDVMRYIC